jgi:hypothetical protein
MSEFCKLLYHRRSDKKTTWYKALLYVPVIVLSLLLQASCGMYQLEAGAKPRFFGLGKIETLPTDKGRLYRVTMPGLGIKSSYLGNGLSLGWHESLLFCVEQENVDHELRCIADQGTSIGLDVSGGGITLGYYRAFRVPLPDPDVAVIQLVHYSEQQSEKTQIFWRELR